MADKTSESKPTERKRAVTVRDLKPKSDPQGGAPKADKNDKADSQTKEADFSWW